MEMFISGRPNWDSLKRPKIQGSVSGSTFSGTHSLAGILSVFLQPALLKCLSKSPGAQPPEKETTMQPCNKANQQHPGLHELQHSGSRQGTLPLCTVLLRWCLQYYTQFGAAQCKRGTESAASPAKTHQDGQGAGAHGVREESKKVCLLSQEGHLTAASNYPKSYREGGDRLFLKLHSRWVEATGTRSSKENYTWLETKKIFRVAQVPREPGASPSLEIFTWTRTSATSPNSEVSLLWAGVGLEDPRNITLSFSSYHSLFGKRKVTLQWMFMKFTLGIKRKSYQSIVLHLPTVIIQSPRLRNFPRTRLSVWTAVSLSQDVNSSHSSWFRGAMKDENIKVLMKKTVHLLHQCLL